jgi:hypothetical protein
MGGQDRDFGPFVQIIWRQAIGRPLLRDEGKYVSGNYSRLDCLRNGCFA